MQATERYSRVDHISYEIEAQERILKAYLLAHNLAQRDVDDEMDPLKYDDKMGGDIYNFPQNRRYFDSLDSLDIDRTIQPEIPQRVTQVDDRDDD